MTNILFVIGSTRKNSFNRQLANITEKLIAKYASNNCSQIQVSYLDFNDVPFFNQDTEFPPPEPTTLAEILSLSPFPMRYLANTPLQAVVEIGMGNIHEQAKRTLELFRAFEKRSNAPLQKISQESKN
jgi:hypothetical protein